MYQNLHCVRSVDVSHLFQIRRQGRDGAGYRTLRGRLDGHTTGRPLRAPLRVHRRSAVVHGRRLRWATFTNRFLVEICTACASLVNVALCSVRDPVRVDDHLPVVPAVRAQHRHGRLHHRQSGEGDEY